MVLFKSQNQHENSSRFNGKLCGTDHKFNGHTEKVDLRMDQNGWGRLLEGTRTGTRPRQWIQFGKVLHGDFYKVQFV